MNQRLAHRHSGFTLIEIMIVVALIAILAAIAMPAYNNYINRGKIKTAQADLVALSLNVENFYQRTLTYPTAGFATTVAVEGEYDGWSPAVDDSFTYSTAVGTANDGGYLIQATGTAGGVLNCTISLNAKGDRLINAACPYGNGAWL